MIRITITAAAFDAIAATIVNHLRALRSAGESYSDMILRVAGSP